MNLKILSQVFDLFLLLRQPHSMNVHYVSHQKIFKELQTTILIYFILFLHAPNISACRYAVPSPPRFPYILPASVRLNMNAS